MVGWKARLKKAAEEKPRRGRPPSTGLVRIYSTGPARDIVRFIMTHDVVERLLQLRDTPQIRLIDTRGLRVRFLRPRELNMPATLMTMEPPTFDPVGQRISRVNSGPERGGLSSNRYQVHIRCKALNLIPGFEPFVVDTLWLDDTRGVLMIFPDDIVEDTRDLINDRAAIIKEATD